MSRKANQTKAEAKAVLKETFTDGVLEGGPMASSFLMKQGMNVSSQAAWRQGSQGTNEFKGNDLRKDQRTLILSATFATR